MPRRVPKQSRSRDKVERILAAAREVLVAEGAGGFNTNRVAREAGVGVGSVYEYFPNKQAIIDRLIEDLAESESTAVLALIAELEGQPLGDVIDRVVDATIGLYDRNRGFYQLLWSMTPAARTVGDRPGERAIVAELERRLEPLATELALDDVPLAAFTCFHLVESLAARMAEQGRAWPAERRAAEIARAVKRYLSLRDG